MSGDFDLVVEGGTIATASDVMRADIGIRDGIVVALGTDLGEGRECVDACGRWVLPGGIDSHVHNSIPGIETRLPILFSQGVAARRISINRFVALTSTNHARICALYPRRGTIAIGADADIAIWHPERETTISQSLLHHDTDYTPYEGLTVKGWPVTTIVRAQAVVRDGALVGEPSGIHLKRAAPMGASAPEAP